MYNIPESDKVCWNCKHFLSGKTGLPVRCDTEKPCVNYRDGNTESYFVPSDLYLQDRFGCEACIHHGYVEICLICSRHYERHYENMWETR